MSNIPHGIPALADKIHFAALAGKRLIGLRQTPDDLRGYLAAEEGVALMLLAEHGPGQGAVVEIGSFLGKSTCWLALGAKAAGREKITAIDHFKPVSSMAASEDELDRKIVELGSTLPVFQQHLEFFRVSHWVEPVVALSVEAAERWDGRPIRLLFIDGNHSYESVRLDYASWSPFVISGGIIAFHDYSPNWPGVIQYYDELMAATDSLTELFTVHSMRVVVKR